MDTVGESCTTEERELDREHPMELGMHLTSTGHGVLDGQV